MNLLNKMAELHAKRYMYLKERLLRHLFLEGMTDEDGLEYLKSNGVMFCSGPMTPKGVEEFHGFGEQLGYITTTVLGMEVRLTFTPISPRFDDFDKGCEE